MQIFKLNNDGQMLPPLPSGMMFRVRWNSSLDQNVLVLDRKGGVCVCVCMCARTPMCVWSEASGDCWVEQKAPAVWGGGPQHCQDVAGFFVSTYRL